MNESNESINQSDLIVVVPAFDCARALTQALASCTSMCIVRRASDDTFVAFAHLTRNDRTEATNFRGKLHNTSNSPRTT
jgi:hypothetical protein